MTTPSTTLAGTPGSGQSAGTNSLYESLMSNMLFSSLFKAAATPLPGSTASNPYPQPGRTGNLLKMQASKSGSSHTLTNWIYMLSGGALILVGILSAARGRATIAITAPAPSVSTP